VNPQLFKTIISRIEDRSQELFLTKDNEKEYKNTY